MLNTLLLLHGGLDGSQFKYQLCMFSLGLLTMLCFFFCLFFFSQCLVYWWIELWSCIHNDWLTAEALHNISFVQNLLLLPESFIITVYCCFCFFPHIMLFYNSCRIHFCVFSNLPLNTFKDVPLAVECEFFLHYSL